jgi:hypothetical protein
LAELLPSGTLRDFSSFETCISSFANNAVEAVMCAAGGAAAGAVLGACVGGAHGGDGGGILGFGIIGQSVGMLAAGVVTSIGGGILATLGGWDISYKVITGMLDGMIGGTLQPWN